MPFGRNDPAVEGEQVCLGCRMEAPVDDRAQKLFARLRADFRTRPEETTVVGALQLVPQQSIEVRLQNIRLFGEQPRLIVSAKTACQRGGVDECAVQHGIQTRTLAHLVTQWIVPDLPLPRKDQTARRLPLTVPVE